MMDVPVQTFRRPRCRLLVSGVEIKGCHAIELAHGNLGQANSFFVQVAIQTSLVGADEPWYGAASLDVSIQMGFLPPGLPEGALTWQEMMSGRVDRVRLDPVTGTVSLDGRDYAARLLDLPVTEGFLNCTSSEVAQQLADRCGLSAAIDQTAAMIGQYYQVEHARTALTRFSRFGTAWDLLSSLAQLEGFDLWVQGSTLYFQSPASSANATHAIDFVAPGQGSASPSLNVSHLVLERSLAMAGGLPVVVSSWNSRQRRRVSAQAGSNSTTSAAAINIIRPNLLPDTAQSLANGVYGQTSGQAQILTATMPGDLSMSPRDSLRLTGIGAGWDGNYRIDTVDREMTFTGGFVQRFSAKTVSA